MFFGSRLVDQITLQSSFDQMAQLAHLGVSARLLVESGMERLPMVGRIIHIAIAERQVESRKRRHRVFGDFVPQTLQTNRDHYMLEPRRRRGALYRPHGRALSG